MDKARNDALNGVPAASPGTDRVLGRSGLPRMY